ncbi:hypothetical protein MKX08_006439 [Trichoderma sp. CBMAI-0020]|nr:hypothetical protein MKX08_006439 [Trichoderma sp. CBMAI-0020]
MADAAYRHTGSITWKRPGRIALIRERSLQMTTLTRTTTVSPVVQEQLNPVHGLIAVRLAKARLEK